MWDFLARYGLMVDGRSAGHAKRAFTGDMPYISPWTLFGTQKLGNFKFRGSKFRDI